MPDVDIVDDSNADVDLEVVFEPLDFKPFGRLYGVVVEEFLELTYGPVAVNLVASAAERDIFCPLSESCVQVNCTNRMKHEDLFCRIHSMSNILGKGSVRKVNVDI